MPDYEAMAETLDRAIDTIQVEYLRSKDDRIDELLPAALGFLDRAFERARNLAGEQEAAHAKD